KIIAISGIPVTHSYQLLQQLQKYKVNVIVQRDPSITHKELWNQADTEFDQELDLNALHKIAQSIGTANPISHIDNLYLLKPIVPKPRNEFSLPPDKQALFNAELAEQKKAIEAIEDPERRNHALRQLHEQEKRLLLGLPSVQDRTVGYNPNPIAL